MVTLRGELVPVPEGAPVLLSGVADGIRSTIAAVKLDDGCEVIIATEDLEEAPPDTQRDPAQDDPAAS